MIPVEAALQQACLTKNEIDNILLVGGSSRIEKISEMLREYFGKPVNKELNPDQAVAAGAAIKAGMLKH